jgi:hypothetical protein
MAKAGQPRHIKPPPRCKAILLCEKILVEPRTKRLSLINVFRSLQLTVVPGQTAPMVVYVQLVDGIGRYDITLQIRDLAQDRIIGKGRGLKVFFPDPLSVHEVTLRIPPLPISHSGKYDVIVFANGQEIDRQQFTIVVPENDEGNKT